MKVRQILRQAYPDWLTEPAIFSRMSGVPWADITSEMDIMYFGARSGDKFASNILYYYMDVNGVLTEAKQDEVAAILKARFERQWSRLWETYTAKYNPLSDYSMTEERERDERVTYGKIVQTAHNTTDARTRTDNLTETTQNTRTDNLSETSNTDELERTFGYNDQDPVRGTPVARSTGTNTTTNTGTQGNAGTVQNTGTQTDNLVKTGSDTDTHSGNDTTHEEGLITRTGLVNRTFQELIADERNLWMWDFVEQLFSDVDKIITLSVHNPKLIRKTYIYEGDA